jgi:hypothetical protein
MLARMPMMAITTSNSIRVNPLLFVVFIIFGVWFVFAPFFRFGTLPFLASQAAL